MEKTSNTIGILLKEHRSELRITLFAIVFFFLAHFVPLPGIDEETIRLFFGEPHISILTSALSDWSIVIIGFSLLSILLQKSDTFSTSHWAAPFAKPVITVTLILSALHSYQWALNLASTASADSGADRSIVVFTMTFSAVAGAALVIALSNLIERYGIGFGFWVMVGLSSILRWNSQISKLPKALIEGATDLSHLLIEAIILALSFFFMIAVLNVRIKNRQPNSVAILWPWMIAPYLSEAIIYALKSLNYESLNYYISQHSPYLANRLNLILMLGFGWYFLRTDDKLSVKLLTLLGFACIVMLDIAKQDLGFDWYPIPLILIPILSIAAQSIILAYRDAFQRNSLRTALNFAEGKTS